MASVYRVDHIPSPLHIGRVGENSFRRFSIDVSDWLVDYPNGIISLTFSRPDGAVYIPTGLSKRGAICTWSPSSTDLAVDGYGSIEVSIRSGGVIGKSKVTKTYTFSSLSNSGTDPEKYMDWYDRAFMSPMRPEKIDRYFYYMRYNDIDYDAGYEYYEKYKPNLGLCSAVSVGDFVGRNYDWTYDTRCSFVVHTPAVKGRHAVIGNAVAPIGITEELIQQGGFSSFYDVIPFMLLDGVNDKGLFCEVNVVPSDYGITTGTNQNGEDLFALMIPRFVLDSAANVDEAIALLRKRNIFAVHSEEYQEEFHFLLRDFSKTVVIEFIHNEMVVIDSFVDGKQVMTNFHLYGYDGSHESLTRYAMGIERYAILSSQYEFLESKEQIFETMKSVRYTKTYSDTETPIWYSEFNGDWTDTRFHVDLTKDSPEEDYAKIREFYIALFNEGRRDPRLWQTVHTAVYDLRSRSMIVCPQEGEAAYKFSLDRNGVIYS